MFKKFVLLSFLLIALFGAAKHAEAQDPDCYDTDNWTCSDWTDDSTRTVYLSYPWDDCPIDAVFSYKICTNNNCTPPKSVMLVRLVRMGWDFDNPDCYDLTAHILPGYNPYDEEETFGTLDEEALAGILRDVERELSNTLFEEMYNGLSAIDQLPYRCINPGCIVPTGVCSGFSIYYVNPKCAAPCILYCDDPMSPCEDYIDMVPCPAEEETCCQYIRTFCACYDGNGNFQGYKVLETSNTIEGDCEDWDFNTPPNSEFDVCPPAPLGKTRYFFPCQALCPLP